MSVSLKVLTSLKWYQSIRQPEYRFFVLYSLKILSMHFNSLLSEITLKSMPHAGIHGKSSL